MRILSRLFIVTFCLGGLSSSVVAQEPPKADAPASTPAEQAESSSSSDTQATYDALVGQAMKAYNRKAYDESIALLDKAYKINPTANLLYNKARIYEEQGKFADALTHYKTFVKAPGVELDDRKRAIERIKALQEIQDTLVEKKPVEPTPTPEAKPAVAPQPAVVRTQDESSVTGPVFMVFGAVVLAGGAGLGVYTSSKESEMQKATSLEQRRDLAGTVESSALATDVLIGTGAGVFLVGALIWALSGDDTPPQSSWLQRVGTDGQRVWISGQF